MRQYSFLEVENCNMCGSTSESHRVLGRRLDRRQGFTPKAKIGVCTSIQRCLHCGLTYANPLPIPLSIDQHYGTSPESYWNDHYFAPDETYLSLQIARYKQLRGQSIDSRYQCALDIGAGIGKGMRALARAGFATFGIEPSAPFRQKAIETIGIEPDKLQLSTVENASFGDSMFDFINFGAVLEHLYDPSSAIEQSLRWLKPQGLIHIEVPSSGYLMNRLTHLFYRLCGSDYVINTSPMHAPYHLYEFTPTSFCLHARKYGYQVAFHEFFPCTAFLPGWIDPLFTKIMDVTRTGMQLAVWLEKNQPHAAVHTRQSCPGRRKSRGPAKLPFADD